MSSQAQDGPRWRNGALQGRERDPDTPSPGPPPGHARSKSNFLQSGLSPSTPMGHVRNQSLQELKSGGLGRTNSRRTGSARGGAAAGTFAPQFIKPENMDGAQDVRVVEGENDLSGKRYIWMRDDEKAFVKGWVVEELPGGMLKAQCEDGTVSGSNTKVRWAWKTDNWYSNAMCPPTVSTRSTQPSSIKQTTWLNLRTSTKPALSTTSTKDILRTSFIHIPASSW